MRTNTLKICGRALVGAACLGLVAMPLAVTGCDRTESKTKVTTTRTTETPDAVKKTTETTEKKVETTP